MGETLARKCLFSVFYYALRVLGMIDKFPDPYKTDIEKAISLLQQIGCTEIYIFGSVAQGASHDLSDLDFAVRGCPAEKFYYAVGKLLSELSHPVDLIDLDRDIQFSQFLQENGDLVRVT